MKNQFILWVNVDNDTVIDAEPYKEFAGSDHVNVRLKCNEGVLNLMISEDVLEKFGERILALAHERKEGVLIPAERKHGAGIY